jgi:hypothetical protein
MRTQFLYVGLLSMMAGGFVGAAGCSDITAGQPTDPTTPPMLVHITIQDAVMAGGTSVQRTSVTDLLDKNPPIACSDELPCLTQFIEAFHAPDFSCSCADPDTGFCGEGMMGTCNDPLLPPASGIPIFASTLAVAGDPGDAGSGEQIRFVFSKVLSNSIETVMMDPKQAPGATDTYVLAPGIIELDDAKGMAVPSVTLYDNGGTPGLAGNTPSDLIQAPLGPAIVLKPMAQLDPKTTYTLKLNTAMIKDRAGQGPVDVAGNALPGTYTITFTTEDITRRSRTSYPRTFPVPDAMTTAAKIAPNEDITFAFWSAVDPATAMIVAADTMGPAGFDPTKVEFYQSQGPDATMCMAGAMSGPTGSLRMVYTDGGMPRMPVDWPVGNYSLHFTVQDRHHISTFDSNSIGKPVQFTVVGPNADPTVSTHTRDQQVTPEQCTGTM